MDFRCSAMPAKSVCRTDGPLPTGPVCHPRSGIAERWQPRFLFGVCKKEEGNSSLLKFIKLTVWHFCLVFYWRGKGHRRTGCPWPGSCCLLPANRVELVSGPYQRFPAPFDPKIYNCKNINPELCCGFFRPGQKRPDIRLERNLCRWRMSRPNRMGSFALFFVAIFHLPTNRPSKIFLFCCWHSRGRWFSLPFFPLSHQHPLAWDNFFYCCC